MKAAGEQSRPRRPRRHLLIFAAAACAGGLALSLTAVLLLDVWVHHKFSQFAGVNIWGYRGPTVGSKARGEYRIVVVGSSHVFGYGVVWSDAIPAQLETKLRNMGNTNQRFSVVNLGYNNEGTYAFRFTLRDFAYLKPDLAILYVGYIDGTNTSIPRHDSALFRLTGYYPLLPMVASEKAMALRYGGDLNFAYSGAAPIGVRPKVAARFAASAIEAAVSAGDAIGRQLRRFKLDPIPFRFENKITPTSAEEDEIQSGFFYREAIIRAVAVARELGTSVLVVARPHSGGEGYDRQLQELQRALADRFGQNPSVRFVDLSRAVDVLDTSLSFDAMHLTASGNGRTADRLLQPVLDMASRGGQRR